MSAAPPTASVVIPARNAAPFVEQAIGSALNQSLADLEVVVVDDGSTDETWALLEACARRDPRVRPLRRARSGGVSAARNHGIAHARGRWIALLDADDLFLPERLESLITQAEVLGADLLADDLLARDFHTGAPLGRCFGSALPSCGSPLSPAALLRGDAPDLDQRSLAKLGFLQPVIRADFLRANGIRYAEDVGAGEDLLLYFECLMRGARLHVLSEALYVYRLRQGSLSCGASAPMQLSRANRRMLRLARETGDRVLIRLVARRQRLLDFNSFVLAAQTGDLGAALRHAVFGHPGLLARQLRVAAGLLRRRLAGGRQGPAFAPDRWTPRSGGARHGKRTETQGWPRDLAHTGKSPPRG
jgi:glycosyltransferase involved in cell wall biosynthesis